MSALLGSYGSMTLAIGSDARIGCVTSPDGVHPILTIDLEHHCLALSPAGHKSPITDDHLAKAHDLARAVAVYVAEVERLHAQTLTAPDETTPDQSTPKPGASAAAA